MAEDKPVEETIEQPTTVSHTSLSLLFLISILPLSIAGEGRRPKEPKDEKSVMSLPPKTSFKIFDIFSWTGGEQ